MGLQGLKLWIMTEILYDNVGHATVLRSFAKPAKDSPVKQGGKVKSKAKIITKSGEEQLWP